ncbi:MAG: hypothetical protein M3254_08150, partial [Actinomycetota bacterium]|nr:hypothetical protein [Actinomycetota bacterium]
MRRADPGTATRGGHFVAETLSSWVKLLGWISEDPYAEEVSALKKYRARRYRRDQKRMYRRYR